jgi:hypothetical protein
MKLAKDENIDLTKHGQTLALQKFSAAFVSDF